MKRIAILLTTIALLVSSLTALANSPAPTSSGSRAGTVCTDVTFPIDGEQANQGNGTGSLATGTGTYSLDTTNNVLTWTVSYQSDVLSGTVTAAHFHGPAPAGTNAGVQVSIGTANPASGTTNLTITQTKEIINDLWYVNVHTTAFPGGEIRGQVLGSECVPDVAINEVRIDQPSGDDDEYVELFGEASTPLDGLTYVVLGDGSGGSGTVEAVIDLSGQAIPSNGYFLMAEDSFALGSANYTTTLNFENGDNVTHLLVMGFSGSLNDDLDTDEDGVLDVIPWLTIVDAVGLVDTTDVPNSGDWYYGASLGFTDVGPDGTFVPAHVFRFPDGNVRVPTGDWNIGTFEIISGDDTPGGPNSTPTAVNVLQTGISTFVPVIALSLIVFLALVTLVSLRWKRK